MLAIALRSLNVAFLVGLAFAVAASANVPAILLTLYWRRFNTTGMVAGMLVGLLSAVVLIVAQPRGDGRRRGGRRRPSPDSARAALSARQPRDRLGPARVPGRGRRHAAAAATRTAEAAYSELNVRANTGLGAV